MALHGSIDSFTVPDVLRLLASTDKSGYLALTGDRGNGGLWLDRGAVVGGRADGTFGRTDAVDVLFELLRFGRGDFAFEEGRECDTPEEPHKVDSIISSAETMLGEFRRLEEIVPSLDVKVTLAPAIQSESVEIDQSLWRTIVAISRSHSVREISDELGLNELHTLRAIRDAVEADLADVAGDKVATTAGPVVDDTFDAEVGYLDGAFDDLDVVMGDEPHDGVARNGSEVAGAFTDGDGATEAATYGDNVATLESDDAAEVARQLANLSPEAAKAVAAAANAKTKKEREQALAALIEADVDPSTVAGFLDAAD